MPTAPRQFKPAYAPTPRSYEADRRATSATKSLYSLAAWRKIRADQLRREPLCRFCIANGIARAATTCDHVEPHRGDVARFWAGPFQSLCAPCHSSAKQRAEQG